MPSNKRIVFLLIIFLWGNFQFIFAEERMKVFAQECFELVQNLEEFNGFSKASYDMYLKDTIGQVGQYLEGFGFPFDGVEHLDLQNFQILPLLKELPEKLKIQLVYQFCLGIQNLGLDYREEYQKPDLSTQEMRALYQDGNNLFLPGLLRRERGCCVSMPMLYLVVGRALGFPIYLVHIGKHSFVRWQEDNFKMNIETTVQSQVAMTPEDMLYLDTEGLTKNGIEGTNYLQNLSDKEVLGKLYFIRSCYFRVKNNIPQAKKDGQHAVSLCSKAPHVQKYLDEIMAL